MAKITAGIFNGIHGKLGNLVFKRRNGITVVCRLPRFRKDEPTTQALIHRKKFAFMVNFLKPLKF